MNVRVTVGSRTTRLTDATAAEVLAHVRRSLDNLSVSEIHIEIERRTTPEGAPHAVHP